MVLALWRYRHFVLASIIGEFRARYARSRLGMAWSILHPLAQAAIFAIILAEVLGAKLPGIDDRAGYPIYLMSGIAAWALFSDIVNRCLTVFLEYSGPLKKIAFPRLCLPVIVWGSAILTHVLLLVAIALVFGLFFRHPPGIAWLVIPFGAVLIAMFGFGLGLTLGIVNVFSRDIGQVTAVVLQLWFWLTPIVYPAAIVPSHLRWLLDLNPMVPLVGIYQQALLHGGWPDLAALIMPFGVAVVLFLFSFLLFRRASAELVDAL